MTPDRRGTAALTRLAPPRHRGLRIGLVVLVAALAAALLVVTPGGIAATGAGDGTALRRAPERAPYLASHRGDRVEAPENTLPAFAAGIAAGARFLETDVRLTSDGVPVLLHDETVDRTTSGTGPVAELTLDELRGLDAGSWFSPEFAGTRVPTLEEFAALLADSDASAMVELKGAGWSVERIAAAVAVFAEHGVAERLVFTSFNIATLERMREAAPEVPRGLAVKLLPGDVAALLESVGAELLLTLPDSLAERPGLVGELHRAGYAVVVFTPNARDRWEQAVELGVDGIVTDRPADFTAWVAAEEG